jgi:hypothetical protein
MRYQQVYNRSLFTNLDQSLIYVTSLGFYTAPGTMPVCPWTVASMQVNLSTTQAAADGLNTNFAANLGNDDTIVFGPRSHDFRGGFPNGPNPELVLFERPFRYNPGSGNLLVDVRIIQGADPPQAPCSSPPLWAYNSATDECSRVWADDVNATSADPRSADTIALETTLQFNPIPSLQSFTFTNAGTNYIEIDWPTVPPTFRLEQSSLGGSNLIWGPPTNIGGIFVSNLVNQSYFFPANSAGNGALYRLLWQGGQ